MRDLERRTRRLEARTPSKGSGEPSPERQAELERKMDALSVDEQLEMLALFDKQRAGTFAGEDQERLAELWSKGDV